jgi:hypothetical protein
LNQCESEILNLKFVKNSTENEVIQEILMKIIKKFIKRWDREGEFLSWSEYLLANRDSEFIDSTSNRLERRNRIILHKRIKFPGKIAIDVVFCIKNYFLLKNIDALSRLNTLLGKGIYHKQYSKDKFNKILSIIDNSFRLRANKKIAKTGVIDIINKILTFLITKNKFQKLL